MCTPLLSFCLRFGLKGISTYLHVVLTDRAPISLSVCGDLLVFIHCRAWQRLPWVLHAALSRGCWREQEGGSSFYRVCDLLQSSLPTFSHSVAIWVCVSRFCLLWLTLLCLVTEHSCCSYGAGLSGLETQQLYCVCVCMCVRTCAYISIVDVCGPGWCGRRGGCRDWMSAWLLTIQFAWLAAHCLQCVTLVLQSTRVEWVHIAEMFLQSIYMLRKAS